MAAPNAVPVPRLQIEGEFPVQGKGGGQSGSNCHDEIRHANDAQVRSARFSFGGFSVLMYRKPFLKVV